ncbi:phage tail protein [Halomonas sp. HK25]|uniref:phage tail-collar fiber domain-containing protein n=1 Tax=Halomonas sp. HK25 TaxID=3394321 RepID=UPI0039FCE541
MTFKTIHTSYGLTRLAEAESTGTPINLPEMAVGDGNGNPADPDPTQTDLVRERFRAPVNRVYQDPADATRFTAELVIPASEGGFVLREVGVYDDQGGLFVVGNLPDTYKPSDGEGAFADTVVRVEFRVSNADVVTLQVDPNVAVATQTWISNNITAGSLIPGGTTGQQLVKKSNTDGDVEWSDPDVVNVTVDIIDERQTLADGQTVMDLATTTTYGLAVYIEGVRLLRGSGADEWQPDPTLETRFTLGRSYPSGTELYAVQNEPSGSAPAPLEKSKNLSDVPDQALGRNNLDVHSKAQSNASGQPGDIKYTARATAPTGWMKANGAAVSRSTYSELFAVLGTQYGDGDGFDTFNLPDLRGEFLRGWDDGRGVDGGRALGSNQNDENKRHGHGASSDTAGSHSHTGSANNNGAHNHSASSSWEGNHRHSQLGNGTGRGGVGQNNKDMVLYETGNTGYAGGHRHSISIGNAGNHGHSLSINSNGNHQHAITVNEAGGSESRPRNVAMLACIKY